MADLDTARAAKARLRTVLAGRDGVCGVGIASAAVALADRQAENKKLDFEVYVAPNVPRAIHTDAKRLQQILKNLLSNAFKFTEKGRVAMDVRTVADGWSPDNETLNRARTVWFLVSGDGKADAVARALADDG